MKDSSPLSGLVILDLTGMLSGPFATMILADLGADVIKIESPQGDFTRRQGPFSPDDHERHFGGYFQSVNRNKRSVVLDLKTIEGREALLRLAESADGIIENFRNGVMDRLGLPFERLAEVNSRLVYVAMRGFGDARLGANRMQAWPAYDITVQALSGVMDATGEPTGPPTKVGPGIGDTIPGLYAVIAMLSGIRRAGVEGRGGFIDVSLYDCLLSMNDRGVYNHSYTGEHLSRQGNTHPLLSPFDVLEARDGWVSIAAPGDEHWAALCAAIGRPDLVMDPRTIDNVVRSRHRDVVRAALTEWTTARTREQIIDALGGLVAVAPVNGTADILADPYLRDRGMLVDVEHPGSPHPVRLVNSPLRFAGEERSPVRRAPLLGEHTAQVLSASKSTGE